MPSRRVFLLSSLGAGLGLAAQTASKKAKAATHPSLHPIGEAGVGPAEDLMREHGVLNRILLIYDEAGRRLRTKADLDAGGIHAAAAIIQRFLQGYHEKLEEEHLFPRFERAGRHVDLVKTLREQHLAGRRLTTDLLAATDAGAFASDASRDQANLIMAAFVRMYRPHEAREDTVLFPAFRDLVTKREYERLGDLFEGQETKVLGERGFERIVEEVGQIERSFGIFDLAGFTPA